MSSEKDYWKPKSNLLSTQEVIDDLHLDAATWLYIAAWFTFAIILYLLRFAIASIGFVIFSSDSNTLFLTLLLDGPILFLSMYISHGLIFKRTNIRKVLPWTALVFLGGYAQFSDAYTLEIVQSADMEMSLFKAIYIGGYTFFVFLTYKYFSNVSPARWLEKTTIKES
tara:strand:+ start:759 stop:1262 length:504 start_codon:yes stop_codon:yes gene_type:complete